MLHDWAEAALRAAAEGGPLVYVAIAFATLITEDVTCIAAGLLVAQGSLPLVPTILACYIGILGGDMLLVLIGRTLGRHSLNTVPLRWWISSSMVARAEYWFERRGPALIFASRFMPGTRVPAYFAAGALRAPLGRFFGWFALACAIWTPLLVGATVIFGETALRVFESWASVAPALLIAGATAWLATKAAVNLSTWRGRRLALSRWRRLTRWEFWPRWVIYPPVALYVLWLGARHRCFTLFTAANPGIGTGGGFAAQSKQNILRGLAAAGDHIARWKLIPKGSIETRVGAVREFMASERVAFPIVLKPDVGEHGQGVVIARAVDDLERALRGSAAPMLAQAYVPGVEFGVFYFRRPHDERGHILAITDKRSVFVIGDGKRSIEDLILADDRAVCMARFFMEQFAGRLDEVPAAGERLALSELGTRSRGALFLDGTHLLTPEVDTAIDRVSRSFAGFYFGRYDVRAESVEAFQRGEFKIIALNGLKSEATNIYDPAHSLWFGWRMLCRQWRIAFEIAAANRARGARPLTLRETWKLVFKPQAA